MTNRPNIILIMVDQMRHDTAGFAGHPHVRTPHLDRFAAEGVCFENAYCAAPQCSPARASWLSGLYPHSHRLLTNYGPGKGDIEGQHLPEHITLIGDVLHDHGYRCGLAGPWHMGRDESPQHGFDAMWEPHRYTDPPEADAYISYLERHDQQHLYGRGRNGRPPSLGRAREFGTMFGDVCALPTQHQRTTWTVDRTISFVEEEDGPFFSFCSIKDPHPPLLPPEECLALYDPDVLELPHNFEGTREGKPEVLTGSGLDIRGRFAPDTFRRVMAHYYALITHIDTQLGRLFDVLKREGKDENTLVAFISDHGEMMGEHGLFAKRVMYEGSVRVPCLLRWPAHLAAGARIREPFGGVDLVPTLLELAGVPVPDALPGTSFAEAAQSGKEPERENVVLAEIGELRQHTRETPVEHLEETTMVRRGRWKYITHRRMEPDELYDLDADPGEMQNLALQPRYRAQCETMRALLRERGGNGAS